MISQLPFLQRRPEGAMRKCGAVVPFMLLLGIGGPLQAQGPGSTVPF